MGNSRRVIDTNVPASQRAFERGLDALYAFNYDEAAFLFTVAARADARCAMCLWGYAQSRGPNINSKDRQTYGARGAAERAAQLAKVPVERALAKALLARFGPASAEYGPPMPAERDRYNAAYVVAMRDVARQFPDDPDVAVALADALLTATRTVPFWDRDGKAFSPDVTEAQQVLERALAKQPDHVGAIHFYVHAIEESKQSAKALPYAERLRTLAPDAGHLIHMSSHVYLRLGRYADSEDANLAALEADRRWIAAHPPGTEYEMFTMHPVHFLWYTLLYAGKGADASRHAEHVGHGPMPDDAGLVKMRAITSARFGKWDEALALPTEGLVPRTAYAVHFARGLALVARGKLDEAGAEIGKIRGVLEVKVEQMPWFHAVTVARERAVLEGNVASAALQLEGAIALARGDQQAGIAALERAVAAEDAKPIEGELRDFPLPARQRLGAALLAAGRAQDAVRVYREDLVEAPENGWSLFGLAKALEALGSSEAAATWERHRKAWARADVRLVSSVM